MSLFQEYDNSLERSCDILFRQFEIDVSRLDNELIIESSINEIEQELFCEGEMLDIDLTPKKKEPKNNFIKYLSSIGEAISRLITDIIDTISNMFSKNSHLDIETYLSSSTGSIEMDNDLKKVHSQVKDEIRKGRKLIQDISNKTNIDDAIIEEYVDRASKGVTKYGKTIVNTASSYTQLKHSTGDLQNLKNDMKSALSDCLASNGDPRKEGATKRVYKSMKNWIAEGTRAYSMFSNNIYKEAMRQQKEEEKKNKKK